MSCLRRPLRSSLLDLYGLTAPERHMTLVKLSKRGSGHTAFARAYERVPDRDGGIAEMVDVFAGFDVVKELLVPDGVREMRERFPNPQRLGRT